MATLTIAEAKERLTIPDLWRQLDLPGTPKKSCRSPFREDRRASFSVFRDGLLFEDFATGEKGDAINFLELATGLPRKAACKRFITMAGGSEWEKPVRAVRRKSRAQRERPKFPDFRHGDAADFERLVELRNLSVEGIQLASQRGLLWFANLRGFDAWVVTDARRVNAQARRMDGGTWAHLDGSPKAWTLPDSWARWPIGARESEPFPTIAFVEGGPDLLAAFHFAWCEDRESDVAPVAMQGASQRIHEDALPLFAGKRVRLFPHTDSAGQDAASRWASQLENVGAEVDAFDFTGLHQASGDPVGDLNELAHIDADEFEDCRELWGIMP